MAGLKYLSVPRKLPYHYDWDWAKMLSCRSQQNSDKVWWIVNLDQALTKLIIIISIYMYLCYVIEIGYALGDANFNL